MNLLFRDLLDLRGEGEYLISTQIERTFRYVLKTRRNLVHSDQRLVELVLLLAKEMDIAYLTSIHR